MRALLCTVAISCAAPSLARASEVFDLVQTGAASALAGQKKAAISALERAALLSPETPGVQESLGCAALLLGERAVAARVLARIDALAVYHAMAVAEGPGGMARARTTLSRAAERPDRSASPGALFLAALAFFEAGQKDRADELLQRAVRLSRSALDEAFAPDPAVCLARAALRVPLEATDEEAPLKRARASIDMASALIAAARRGEAVRIAESLLDQKPARAAALRVLVLIENAALARRALARVEKALVVEPKEEDLLVARALLLLRIGEDERARRYLEALGSVEDNELSAELHRARAELALAAGDAAVALELSELAVRADPKSDAAVATHVRALVQTGRHQRARSFAAALIKRKPQGVNPFQLAAEIHAAEKATQKAEGDRLRARAFDAERAKIEREVRAREEVIRAVRDAESGVGAIGLEAVRGEHPGLSLPVDLAIAKLGVSGSARVARDRVLQGCAPLLKTILRRTKSWDLTEVDAALYGHRERYEAPISAADPARCTARRPEVKRIRR